MSCKENHCCFNQLLRGVSRQFLLHRGRQINGQQHVFLLQTRLGCHCARNGGRVGATHTHTNIIAQRRVARVGCANEWKGESR